MRRKGKGRKMGSSLSGVSGFDQRLTRFYLLNVGLLGWGFNGLRIWFGLDLDLVLIITRVHLVCICNKAQGLNLPRLYY